MITCCLFKQQLQPGAIFLHHLAHLWAKLQFSTYFPPLHSGASNSDSLSPGGCESAGHSCPFIKQRMTQSPSAICFLQVELKDVDFSLATLSHFRDCYLKTVSYPGDTIAFFPVTLEVSAWLSSQRKLKCINVYLDLLYCGCCNVNTSLLSASGGLTNRDKREG